MKANRRIRDLRRRSRGPRYCHECGHLKANHTRYKAGWICAGTVGIRIRRAFRRIKADCVCTGTSRRYAGSSSHTKTIKEAA